MAISPKPASRWIRRPWSMSTRCSAAYYDTTPDPADPAQRVAFGTSGHRGSAFRGAFNEAHILAITEAICRYRLGRGYTGPLFLGRDTHALSEPATRTALGVLVANGVDVRIDASDGYTPTPALSHAIIVANRPSGQLAPTWRTGSSSRRRTTRPTTAASSTTRPTAARPTPTSRAGSRTRPIASSRRRGATGWTGSSGSPMSMPASASTPYDFMGIYVADLDAVIDMNAIAKSGPAHRRRPDGRRVGALLGRDRRALRPGPDRHQRQGRPAVRVHDRRLGRQDPDGPVVAACDGPPRRAARRVRHRARQRRRRRPPRRRHPDGAGCSTRTTSCPRRSPTCSAGRAAGAARWRSARRSCRRR